MWEYSIEQQMGSCSEEDICNLLDAAVLETLRKVMKKPSG
jgi:hypothetical protein